MKRTVDWASVKHHGERRRKRSQAVAKAKRERLRVVVVVVKPPFRTAFDV